MSATTEELLTEAKARLKDIALGALMMSQRSPFSGSGPDGPLQRYAMEVLRVATSCLDPYCEAESLCDECYAKHLKEHAHLRHSIPPDPAQYEQDMRDAGRGHLLRD